MKVSSERFFKASSQSLRVTDSSEWIEDPRCSLPKVCSQELKGQLPEKTEGPCGARVILTANFWVDVGLVNGAIGTVVDICYQSGGPPNFLQEGKLRAQHTGTHGWPVECNSASMV